MRSLFGTDGIRGKINTHPMTPSSILTVGQAAAVVIAKHAKKNGKQKVIIAKDTRSSGYIFEYALTAGLCSLGIDVYQIGPMPTPALAHLVKSFAADAGVMITASHNPATDNGIKFFAADGHKLPDAIEEEIEAAVQKNAIPLMTNPQNVGRAYKIEDARGRYIEYVKHSIKNRSLKGIKIVLDCANGAAYKVAPLIFQELGADVLVINAKPDGININQNCGALHPELLQKKVKEEKATIGIALDGDADRVILVDEKGNIVSGDQILAIAAVHYKLKGKLDNNTVVTTVMTNAGFEEFMQQYGITVFRTSVGDRYVIEAMKEKNLTLGGEQAGHIIFGKHTTTGDGTLAALQILSIMQQTKKPLSSLASGMPIYPQVLLNVAVKEKKSIENMPKVLAEIKKAEKELSGKGRVLVRYSGTENCCRVMIEGKDRRQIEQLSKKIAASIQQEVGVKK